MYKVLIADDEANIRSGLKSIVDWQSLGYEIAGEARNGEEALRFLERERPDLALLDIRMPRMTGLEVIRRAREQGYNGEIIILSGYSDFAFAQEAIRYNVRLYLTKPIDEEELTRILGDLRSRLADAAQLRSGELQYRRHARESLLRGLLTDPASVLPAGLFGPDDVPCRVVLYESYRPIRDRDIIPFEQLLRLTADEAGRLEYTELEESRVLLLKGSGMLQRFEAFLSRARQGDDATCSAALQHVFLCCGRVADTPQDIHRSYEDASRLRERRFFCEQHRHILDQSDLPDPETKPARPDETLLNGFCDRLLQYVQSFNRAMLADTLRSLQDTLRDSGCAVNEARYFLTDLFLRVKAAILRSYETADIPFPTNSWIMDHVQTLPYLFEIIRFFSEQFELIMAGIRYYSGDTVLDEIIQYIDHNYMNDLKLEAIASLFGYNASYLGKIFKQRTGYSFNTYLDRVRIEHAKVLLARGELKIFEIASRVGYSSVDYFYQKFRKYVGEKATEYRKKRVSDQHEGSR